MINKEELVELYITEDLPVIEIANMLNVPIASVVYCIYKYKLNHQRICTTYRLKNLHKPEEFLLLGIGLGLFWSTETNNIDFHHSDPSAIRAVITFLVKLFDTPLESLQFELHTGVHIEQQKVINYWKESIPSISHRIKIKTNSETKGTACKRVGVMKVSLQNERLRRLLVSLLPK